ncbi:TRAF family member-associated NF-kappa-B activator [Bagarius yarrelli]|uniref:TRAF family member-associated NF-kappa-B activator n=1 Tax=Bagarius yarrelli TaxID=175774 RepID=A0A556U4K7_BAGYA|nr:TRAF family member-associated NF-kappa-B activator [Bagarius yarrelli]
MKHTSLAPPALFTFVIMSLSHPSPILYHSIDSCLTHDSCVRDVTEGCGMDRNIGDPLNKAYEAYRNISIENENAKKLLQEKTEQFHRYTQQLEKKIEHQEREISELKAQLKLIKHTSAEQQFSMPIQCTDNSAEQVEEPFSSSSQPRPKVDESVTSGALASRGASPEEGDFMNDIKFPPSADSEYEFLHSAPDRSVPLPLHRKDLSEPISTVLEESYSYSASTQASHLLPASVPHEGVRGPQQPLWSPDLNPAAESETSSTGSAHCTFCKATVPSDLMYSHLNSHFQGKASD